MNASALTTPSLRPAAPGAPAEIRRILLATDLSPVSELATDWAFGVAGKNDAALLVVSVIDPHELRGTNGAPKRRVEEVRDAREAAAQALVERGRHVGVPVTFLVWTGDPGESIVAAAEAEEVDLLVVGAHDRAALGRLLLGSVSEHVARHAPCPVLVVRATPPTRPTE